MTFDYVWHRQEANFGPPIDREVSGGTHISCENFLKFGDSFVALRRPQAIPEHEIPAKAEDTKPMLYFVHGLPLWGESLHTYVSRIVREQADVAVKSFRVVDLAARVYEDTQQWAWTPYLVVEIDSLPKPGHYGSEVTEVVTFTADAIPDEFGWWEVDELRRLLAEHGA